MTEREIRISGARSHNLRDISCRIPLRSLTVISGVSGSGKSTLAFDTLYAEGQRRYVSSLSTYARQFLERLPRPDVDSITHLPPAIAIEQRNRVTNARSTVGTATEILDHLRLLFARAGDTRCAACQRDVVPGTVDAVTGRILERFVGRRVSLVAPLPPLPPGAEALDGLRDRLAREGFTRVLDGLGEVFDWTTLASDALAERCADALLVIDRIALRKTSDARGRLAEAVSSGFVRGDGRLVVVAEDGERGSYREGFACDGCGRLFPTPEPALFSFNSPLGACARCQGFGRVAGLDLARVIPDPELSLERGAIAPFSTTGNRPLKSELLREARRLGVPTDRPYRELDANQHELILEGDGADWSGVRGYFSWLEARRYKVQNRVLIARYRRFDPCPDCQGLRLCDDARSVWIGDKNLGQLSRLGIEELGGWLAALELDEARLARVERLLVSLRARVETVLGVGLGYLGLDRQVRTLSGGEAQRIQLATALGGSLTSSLYVLDEPSIGLHPRDVDRLLNVLSTIRDQGNTVVVVEHAPEIVAAADHVIDLGPGAGRQGGSVVVEGGVADVMAHPESLTGRALRGDFSSSSQSGRTGRDAKSPRRARGRLRIRGARENNLKNLDVDIALGQLVVVTGVSGAGKSSLVRSVLVGNLHRARHLGAGRAVDRVEPGLCDAIEGSEQIRELVVVDQSPAARSPRSNPATVSKAFDGIRKIFAATRQARALGVGPGWFSFNVPGGRCDTCEGSGEVVIDMQFLDDLRVPCDACHGLRYRREVLEVRVDGRSIVDVLEMTIDDALKLFAGERVISERLEPFARVGLGYLAIGQPLSTLSGGEHQRVRLALALGEGAAGALYVLDEPTTGLHPADVHQLLGCLDQLITAGGSVIVVEHNLDVIRRADSVLDLGPEGGPRGGLVVAAGTPAEVAAITSSYTGAALRGAL